MNKDDEREWIDTGALTVLELIEEEEDDIRDFAVWHQWITDGRPLLSDKAKARLEAVEKALETCENCRGRLTFNSCNSGGVQVYAEKQECPLAPIRRAWEKEK